MPRNKQASFVGARRDDEGTSSRPTRARQHQPETPTSSMFIDQQARDRYHLYLEKSIINQRVVREIDISGLGLSFIDDKFSKQPWGRLIHFHENAYHEMCCQFLANLRKGDRPNTIISRVNNKDISFDGDLVNRIFYTTPREGVEVSRFFSLTTWATTNDHFDRAELGSYFSVHFTSAKDAKPSSLIPIHRILLSIVSNLLAPTDGHRGEPNRLTLYLFYCVMKEITLDFGFHMCEFILTCTHDLRRSIPFAKFLTRIFKYFHIPITGKATECQYYTQSYFEYFSLKFYYGEWITKAEAKRRSTQVHIGGENSDDETALPIPPLSSSPRPSTSRPSTHTHTASYEDMITHLQRVESYLMSMDTRIESRFVTLETKLDGVSGELDQIRQHISYTSERTRQDPNFDDNFNPEDLDRPLSEGELFGNIPPIVDPPAPIPQTSLAHAGSSSGSEATISISPAPAPARHIRLPPAQRLWQRVYQRKKSARHDA